MTSGVKQEFDLRTRGVYAKVKCEIALRVDGTELPNLAVLGKALDEAIQKVQDVVTESYVKVPERV